MKTIHDADALLIYKVGPVYCCSPTFSVEAVMMPPKLSHPPGTSRSVPGVFRYVNGMVKVVDLRQRFGLAEDRWQQPGKIIVVEVESGRTGFWVDEILDVTEFPQQGWKPIGALIPKQLFSRTLLMNDKIHLYADFEKLAHFQESGYLREHIQQLLHEEKPASSHAEKTPQDKIKHKEVLKNPESSIADKTQETKESKPSPSPLNSSPAIRGTQLSVDNTEKQSHSAEQFNVVEKAENKKTKQPAKSLLQSINTGREEKISAMGKREPLKSAEAASREGIKKADNISHSFKSEPTAFTSSVKDTIPHYEARKKPPEKIKNSHAFEWFAGVMLLVILFSGAYFIYQPVDNAPEAMTVYKNKAADSTLVEQSDKKLFESAPLSDKEAADNLSLQTETGVDHAYKAEDDEAEYQAKIEKDNQGITIILTKGNDSQTEIIPEPVAEAEAEDIDLKADMPVKDILPAKKETVDSQPSEISVPVKVTEPVEVEVEKVATKNIEAVLVQQKKQPQVIIHIVVKGDTLWHIAKKYVHNPFKYAELARLSKIKNPDLIYPGDRVRIIKLFKEE